MTVDLGDVDPSENITLSIGWRSGKKMKLSQVILTPEVANVFRETVTDTLDNVTERTHEPWTPEADDGPDVCLALDQSGLGTVPLLASEHGGQTFAESLQAAEALPVTTAPNVPAANLELYAMTIGSTPGSRTALVRRTNPRRSLRAGRLFTSLSDTLARLDEPVFGFDLTFDLIFHYDQTYVLSQAAFRALFRDQDALKAQVPAWTGALAAHVPMASACQDRLTDKALRDRRIANRLETIVIRGHLEGVTSEVLRSTMAAVGLDPNVLMNNQGKLNFEEEHIPTVLQFLNEDLFYGAITNVGFRADKKAVR